jgi:hypothetical protein
MTCVRSRLDRYKKERQPDTKKEYTCWTAPATPRCHASRAGCLCSGDSVQCRHATTIQALIVTTRKGAARPAIALGSCFSSVACHWQRVDYSERRHPFQRQRKSRRVVMVPGSLNRLHPKLSRQQEPPKWSPLFNALSPVPFRMPVKVQPICFNDGTEQTVSAELPTIIFSLPPCHPREHLLRH